MLLFICLEATARLSALIGKAPPTYPDEVCLLFLCPMIYCILIGFHLTMHSLNNFIFHINANNLSSHINLCERDLEWMCHAWWSCNWCLLTCEFTFSPMQMATLLTILPLCVCVCIFPTVFTAFLHCYWRIANICQHCKAAIKNRVETNNVCCSFEIIG